jgi:hypothetical protein
MDEVTHNRREVAKQIIAELAITDRGEIAQVHGVVAELGTGGALRLAKLSLRCGRKKNVFFFSRAREQIPRDRWRFVFVAPPEADRIRLPAAPGTLGYKTPVAQARVCDEDDPSADPVTSPDDDTESELALPASVWRRRKCGNGRTAPPRPIAQLRAEADAVRRQRNRAAHPPSAQRATTQPGALVTVRPQILATESGLLVVQAPYHGTQQLIFVPVRFREAVQTAEENGAVELLLKGDWRWLRHRDQPVFVARWVELVNPNASQ